MPLAKVTLKGQVTIPKQVRRQLGIEDGDFVLFQIENAKAMIERVRRASLLDFGGVFPAPRAFPGKEQVRAEVRRQVARRLGQPRG